MAKKAASGNAAKLRGVRKTPRSGAPHPKIREAALLAQTLRFPIVGVGASAGGLEAFTELLKALPPDPKMAFVFIVHMAASHESMLPQLLAKATSMPVLQVSDDLAVEPNHVYIIPPNAGMTIAGGTLLLAARKETGKILPIDDFLVALAEDRQSSAIGVILSGTASDGTLGMKAIKAAGGITFAQDEASARFPEMPRSAAATGCVDFTLPPGRISAELARIGRHPYLNVRPESSSNEPSEVVDESLRKICLALRSATGVDFHLYKPATLSRRVARRMALLKIGTIEKYLRLLNSDRAEVNALYEDIFIHVTGFFRDPEALAALSHTFLPRALEAHRAGEPVRIWVAGCSSGEEVYSLAIAMLEARGDRADQTRFQFFGTDVSEAAIEQARHGLYAEPEMLHVAPELRRRYFVKVEGGYQIAKRIRDMCVFARHDVTRDPPFSKLDFISCRNVLIYFGPVLHKRVAEMFHYALKPSGYLLLGRSESLNLHGTLFAAEDPKLRIFSRKPLPAPAYPNAGALGYAGAQPDAATPSAPAPYDLRRETERLLLDQFVPAALVVDPDLQIVHFQGSTSRYLAPATGQPSFHLLRMVRPELVVDLRTAIYEAKKTGAVVRRGGIRLKQRGATALVEIQVTPLSGRHSKDVDFLVVLRDSEQSATPVAGRSKKKTATRSRETPAVSQLHRELATSREQLKDIIEEHEAAREEMTAINEEVVSSNEELQSTNEELETAKEELQSSNEELITLNDELQNRNTELGQQANDLGNLLVGVEIPIVILDRDLRIRRFTPAAEKVLNLIAADAGRPLTDLAPTLDLDWKELAAEVIEHRRIVDRDVRDGKGHWYSLRMRPYQTTEHRVDGVLVALVDIDVARRSLDEIREARELAEGIVETIREPLLILDSGLRVLKATHRYYETFRTSAPDTEGRAFFELGHCQWDVPGLRILLEEILPRDSRIENFEVAHEFPVIGYRCILLNACRILRPAAGKPMILLAMEDTTERRQAEELLRQRERVIQEASSQAILSASPDGKIRMANLRAAEMFGYTREELLDLDVDLLLPERDRKVRVAHRAEYLANPMSRAIGLDRELKGRHKDGTEFPISVHLSYIETNDGPMSIDIVTDQTERKKVEHALQLTQQRLSLAQEVAGIGVWDWDSASGEAQYSREWGPLYGLPAGAQPHTQEEWLALVHPDDRVSLERARNAALASGVPYSAEFRVVWADGSTHWLHARGASVRDEDRAVGRLVGVDVDVTARKRAESERQALLARLVNAQEEERRRISRDLHDNLTQNLAGLAMEVAGLTADFPAASERLKRRLRALQGSLVQAAEGARHAAHELHPSELDDLGIVAALRAYCDEFAQREGTPVEFRSGLLPKALARESASCLYRVTQESLRNVSKHAKARRVFVTVEAVNHHVRLSVRDDGIGLALQSLDATGGLGILGMRERAKYANGTFDIRSQPGSGVEITVDLPLKV